MEAKTLLLVIAIITVIVLIAVLIIQKNKVKLLINNARDMELSVGEYLFELLSGDTDAYDILESYLEVPEN